MQKEVQQHEKKLFQITDAGRTAWFTSERINKMAPAAALFSKVFSVSPDPDISTVEQCAGIDLCPISKRKYDAGVQEFISSFRNGLISEIDLCGGQSRFTRWGFFRDTVYQVNCSISELAGIYEAAFDKTRGELYTMRFIDTLKEHSAWNAISGLAAEAEQQEQAPPQQGMMMF